MKIIKIRKKQLIIFTLILIVLAVISIENKASMAMQHYYKLDFSTGIGVVKSPRYGKMYVQMFISK